MPTDGVYDIPEELPERLEASVFLRNVVPRDMLSCLWSLELVYQREHTALSSRVRADPVAVVATRRKRGDQSVFCIYLMALVIASYGDD